MFYFKATQCCHRASEVTCLDQNPQVQSLREKVLVLSKPVNFCLNT